MATATLPRYITVAEFERMEFDPDREYELLDGEIIEVSHPSYRHFQVAERVALLLRRTLGGRCRVGREMPYVVETGTKRRADVGVVSAARDQAAVEARKLDGAPEVVVEIVSPSNLSSHDRRTARLCLRNGTLQFWMVYLDDATVEVRTPDNLTRTYEGGTRILLPDALGAGEIAVDEVFSEESTPLS